MMIVASVARKYVRVVRIQAGELQLRKETERQLIADGYEPYDLIPICKAIDKFITHFGGISDAAKSALINLKEINMDVKTATTAALIEFYNKHSEKPVKKFADRATAEKRCQAIIDALAAKAPAVHKREEDKKEHHRQRASDKKEAKKTERKAKEPKEEAVRKSTVLVTPITKGNKKGEQASYRSVYDAFEKLGLPINQHKKFRKELKANGKGVYENDGTKYEFVTV